MFYAEAMKPFFPKNFTDETENIHKLYYIYEYSMISGNPSNLSILFETK